jgi:hypothetical protein
MVWVKMMTPQRTLDYGSFTIVENSFGYQSYDKEGKPLVFSASEIDTSYWTNRYLKAQQEGWK